MGNLEKLGIYTQNDLGAHLGCGEIGYIHPIGKKGTPGGFLGERDEGTAALPGTLSFPSTPDLSLAIPMPPKMLGPNHLAGTARGRIARAAATKRYRLLVCQAVQECELDDLPWPAVRVQLVFYWPDKRRRDTRNAEASMKAAYDGLVDAGLIADDSPEYMAHLPTRFEIDVACPRVEFLIWRA